MRRIAAPATPRHDVRPRTREGGRRMSEEIQDLRSRRGVLFGVLGGVAGLVGSRFVAAPAVKAADGDNVVLGQSNTGASTTGFTATDSDAIVAQSDSVGGTGVIAIGD